MLFEVILNEMIFLIELFVLIYSLVVFTDLKITSKKYKHMVCVLFAVIINSVIFLFIPKIIAPTEVLLFYITIICNFDGSFIRKSKYFIVLYLTTGIVEVLLLLLEQLISEYLNIRTDENSLFYINYFIIMMIITVYAKIKKKKKVLNSAYSNYIGIMCVILIVCSACFYFIFKRNMNMSAKGLTSFYIICTFIGCIILMAIFVFFVKAERERLHYKYESEFKDNLMKANSEHYKSTIENYEEFRRQRHDFKGHMVVMYDHVKKKNYAALDEYMSEVYDNYVLSDTTIHVNYETADSVLNYFANKAEQEGIDFECDGRFRSKITMSPFQLCTCFYNLLNNALEACRKIESGEKVILVTIRSFRGTLVLSFENSVAEPVEKSYWATGVSSKANSKAHGLGLLNVKNVVEELEGQMIFKNIETDKGCRFRVEVILPPNNEADFMEVP